MDVQQKATPILIYYNMRGQAHAIRGLFCYLQIQFVEVHLQRFQQQKKTLPLTVLHRLKNLKIDKTLLPILIDQREMICDTYPILAYLCYRHEREDLLGRTLEEKARLQQIIEVYVVKQPQAMGQFFRFSQFCAEHQYDQIYIEMRKSYTGLMDHSQYMKELCFMIHTRSPQKFIFEGISILDFLFLESCTYMLGVFQNLDRDFHEQIQKEQDSNANINGIRYDLMIDLKIMRQFRQRMTQQAYYIENKSFLQSFKFTIAANMDKIKGIKKVWLGDPAVVQ